MMADWDIFVPFCQGIKVVKILSNFALAQKGASTADTPMMGDGCWRVELRVGRKGTIGGGG